MSVNVISPTHHYWIKQQLLSDISFFAKKSPKSWKIKLSICAEQLGLYPEDYIFLFPFFCGKSYIFRESSSITLIYILYNSVDPCLLNDAESWINQLILTIDKENKYIAEAGRKISIDQYHKTLSASYSANFNEILQKQCLEYR